ncbi:hypothetical protein ACE1CD_30000 [Aerosakkonema sp. BLCC-F183]|uniref:hypothetical protein n=1 Tax=Aerosakkonema sp. BLCC-F183 TaxID=3342834 RepID=UPI0035B92BC7
MFKINKFFHKPHPYQEALHTLLYSYPDGLSATEIADKLGISNSECDRLLKQEQIRDTIDVEPWTGTLIFKSQITTKPRYSLKEALKMAKRLKFLLGVEISLAILSSTLVGVTLISIPLNISLSFGSSNRDDVKQISGIWHSKNNEDLLKARVEAEIATQKRIEIENQRNDLNIRIANMESLPAKSGCSKYWLQGQTCYLEGRLLSQAEFEREMAEMRLEVSKLNEILSLYSK